MIRIRRVDASDPVVRAELLVMDEQLFPPAHNVAPGLDRGAWWIAEIDGRVVGYAGALVWEPDRCLYLTRAGVLPEARGRGLQRRLIRARVAHARRLGLTGAYTYTLNWNEKSANNLIACGFRLWWPARPWAAKSAVYWYRDV